MTSEMRTPLAPPRSRAERLITIAVGLLALFAIVVVIGLISLDHTNRQVMQEVQRTRDARLAAYGLMQASIDAETAQRGYLLTNDREFLVPYDSGRARADEHLRRLDALSRDNSALHTQFQRVEADTRRSLAMLADTIQQRSNGTLSAREMRASLTVSKDSMDDTRTEIAEMMRLVEDQIDAYRAEERSTRDALFFIGSLLAALALLSVAVTMLVLRAEQRNWRAAYAASEGARQAALASELAKSRFLAVASHDMRQPLHALTLYLTALERRVETDEARGIVAKMDRAVQSMIGMFTSLLDLARLQAGVMTPDPVDIALQDVIDAAIGEHPAGSVTSAETTARVHTDARLLTRLLSILISNAIRHGGGNARLEARAERGDIVLTVADDGPGIAPADQQRIFEEFERLNASADGLGLGLPIARKLGELLGAPLTLQSTEGQGARFSIRLQQTNAPTSARTAPTASATALHGAPVLVMDDDTLAREAIAGLLSDLGAEVRTCANGDEAQALLASGYRPRLLVLDLRIRGELRGLEIAAALTAKLDPPPRTIMVTGDTGPDTLAALRQSGHGWLIKPIKPQDLRDTAAAELNAA